MLQLVLLVKTTILLENIFKGYLAIRSINSRQDNINLLPRKEVYFFLKEAFFVLRMLTQSSIKFTICSSFIWVQLGKAMAPHSSTLAWKIPWTEEPGRLQRSRAQLSDFTFIFHFHALEKEMATLSSVLAWRIPGMEEPDGLPSMGSHRVEHDWSNLAAAAATS